MSVILEEGSKLPKVKVETEDGVQKLSDVLDGDLNVLFFYPKDNTSGCTKEACSFTEHSAKFKKLGVKIFGISPDSQKSHEKFIEKYSLKFPLLTDSEHEVAQAFGVWQEKSMYGKKYMGIVRSTFLIDGKGEILKVWPKVKVEGHVEEVLAAAKK